MFTRVKTPQEIEAMRESGQMLATVLTKVSQVAAPGITGKDIAEMARIEVKGLGGKPTFLGMYGFPDVICISLNDAIVHGIPSATPFEEGDLVSFDFGVTYKGMITDSALTLCLGETTGEKKKLLRETECSLYAGIGKLKDGVRVGDVAAAIQKVLDDAGLGIVRDMVGHGVGHELHEDPNIPNYGTRGTGPVLRSGMTIAIEPMATLGTHEIVSDEDKWTIRTADGSLSAHFEHTILITDDGFEVLTAR